MKFMVLKQVTKTICTQRLRQQFRTYVQNENPLLPRALFPLHHRKLLQVSGKDASVFLQGLVTNDMRHFDEGSKSIYAMFLNNKGRVLYDTLIYKWDDSYMLECDESVLSKLEKYLKLFKLKRDVNIMPTEKDLNLWVLMNGNDLAFKEKPSQDILVYKDPRLTDLGFRILTVKSVSGSDILNNIDRKDICVKTDAEGYKLSRYQLGISEGPDDLTPGSSFPLEANCDYLHGVSFHKGCYIGQELTARVHHTGVVRKRIMPIKFVGNIKDNLEPDTNILSSKDAKISLGKLKSYAGDYGLALLRVKESVETKFLSIGNYTAEVIKPIWWPKEAPKEKINKLEKETELTQ